MRTFKFITLLFITTISFSQVPSVPGTPQIVTDPGNNAQLVKTVDNTLRTLKLSKESLDITKKALEDAKKINNAIQSSKLTMQITENLRETYSNLSDIPNLIENIKNPTIRKNLIKHCNNLFTDIDVFQDVLSSILTNNILAMNDSERLTLLTSYYDKSKEIMNDSDRLKKLILKSR